MSSSFARIMNTVESGSHPDDGSMTICTIYDYDGLHFVIEVEADAVQTHNAQSAMTSAWGVSYPVDGQ